MSAFSGVSAAVIIASPLTLACFEVHAVVATQFINHFPSDFNLSAVEYQKLRHTQFTPQTHNVYMYMLLILYKSIYVASLCIALVLIATHCMLIACCKLFISAVLDSADISVCF